MEKINWDDIYVVNPNYKIRSDKKRCVVTNNNSMLMKSKWASQIEIETDISWIIHPYLAYIFSFFNNQITLREIFEKLSQLLGIEVSQIADSILPVINNNETKIVSFQNLKSSGIPKNFIIKNNPDEEYFSNVLSTQSVLEILKDVDIDSNRLYIPNQMYLMVNNVCVTDCVYCYADKSHKVSNTISFKRVKELIAEASSLGMRDFEICGGEFFIYKHWKEVIKELHKYQYSPYISTKFPITQEILDSLLECNITSIQLSIDSVDNEEIKRILNVDNDYLDKVKQGVELLNNANIEICVKPVITKYNDSLESVQNLLDYLVRFEMVKKINIAPGAYSIYKPFNYSTNVAKIKEIQELVNKYEVKYPNIEISMQGYEVEVSVDDRMRDFGDRGACSGNLSSFYALPDGKVTICEQMYWHPNFILGDLANQSIMEVWNSQKALSLWNIKQEEIQDDSPCKTCDYFDECRRGRGNCWRLAVAAYGWENYDYPAPNCPYAPPIKGDYYMPE
jgi:radical SAM protein with 4Fe4S-binding SPASM domain